MEERTDRREALHYLWRMGAITHREYYNTLRADEGFDPLPGPSVIAPEFDQLTHGEYCKPVIRGTHRRSWIVRLFKGE